MRLTTTFAAAAAIAVSGAAANAGGLAPVATAEPVTIVTEAPAGSVPSAYIVLGLVAALVALASDSDSSEATGS